MSSCRRTIDWTPTTPLGNMNRELDQMIGCVQPESVTTAEMNAISDPATGLVKYNSTLGTLVFYNGTSWKQVDSSDIT